MRLVSAALLLALSGAVALADDAKPAESKPAEPRAKVPLRVVRMLPETHQALLFDRTRGNYVVVEAGQTVEGLTVDAIDDDEVSLLSDGGALVVLAAPAPAKHRHAASSGNDDDDAPAKEPTIAAAAPAPTPPAKAEPQPADPYAAMPAEPAPADPYADPVELVDASTALGTGKDGVRVVEAPGTPATVTVTTAPAAAPAVIPAVAKPVAATPAPVRPATKGADDGAALAAVMTGTPAPATPALATTTVPADGPAVLARADVSAALANFGALSGSIRGGFTADGLRIESVAAGSLFAKAGLRAGDVVASVDGHALRSLDDAAELYARAPAAKAMTASVLRGGKPVTLRVSIQ